MRLGDDVSRFPSQGVAEQSLAALTHHFAHCQCVFIFGHLSAGHGDSSVVLIGFYIVEPMCLYVKLYRLVALAADVSDLSQVKITLKALIVIHK